MDILKVTKGLLVVMKGIRDKSLYMLQGSIVIGDTSVVTESKESYLVSLWHRRWVM